MHVALRIGPVSDVRKRSPESRLTGGSTSLLCCCLEPCDCRLRDMMMCEGLTVVPEWLHKLWMVPSEYEFLFWREPQCQLCGFLEPLQTC